MQQRYPSEPSAISKTKNALRWNNRWVGVTRCAKGFRLDNRRTGISGLRLLTANASWVEKPPGLQKWQPDLQASGVGRGVRVRIYPLGEPASSIRESRMSYCDAKDAQEGKDYPVHAEESLAVG